MTDLLRKIEAARVLAAEDAVVASIPAELLENARKANAAFKAKGGCPECKSTSIGIHYGGCAALDEYDFY
jgi:hypothetical protein